MRKGPAIFNTISNVVSELGWPDDHATARLSRRLLRWPRERSACMHARRDGERADDPLRRLVHDRDRLRRVLSTGERSSLNVGHRDLRRT